MRTNNHDDNLGPTVASLNHSTRRKRICRVNVDISACRYAIIRKCLRDRGFRLIKKSTDPSIGGPTNSPKCDIWWSDRGDLLHELPRLSPFQKVNHFPSMEEICRKDFLANNLNAIYKVLPNEFKFFPRSFLLPASSVDLRDTMDSGPKHETYIVKPRTLCQGKGISLVQSFSKIPSHEPCVVQRYIDNPLLIDGYKFDLRIYVLVMSVNPIQIYIFRNGLARFCTTPFAKPTRKNLNEKRMHLTNYAINKKSKNFQPATSRGTENQGSKRSLASIMKYLDETGSCSSQHVWTQICDIVVKTLLCVEPKLQASYKSYFGSAMNESEARWGPKCFEILGFDIMLDTAGKAWLFEVNHAPSFAGDSPLDKEIKSALISSTLDLVGITNEKKQQYLKQTRRELKNRLWKVHSKNTTANTEVHTAIRNSTCLQSQQVELVGEPANESEMSGCEDSGTDSPKSTNEDDMNTADIKHDDRPINSTYPSLARTITMEAVRAIGASTNVLRAKNRVFPISSDKLIEPNVVFENQFSLIFPIADFDENIERYEQVRHAALVNKSKLWN